jgi:hypothetical protein
MRPWNREDAVHSNVVSSGSDTVLELRVYHAKAISEWMPINRLM